MKLTTTPPWLLLLSQFASFVILLSNSAQAVADTGDSGVIRIDCGARNDYWDKKTKSHYLADDDGLFVEFGEMHSVSSDYTKEQIGNQLNSLKSFPRGKRNCYTLKPTLGKNTHYLVRAFFAYGNYDRKRRIPSFDLYIGANYWATINQRDGDIVQNEVIHVSPTDNINVCLVNTGQGTPYISLLEALPLQNSRYDQTASSLLRLMSRSKLGMSEDATYIRYPDDIYGRSWFNRKIENSEPIWATTAIDSNISENTYKLPKEVLSSGVQAVNVNSSLVINMDSYSPTYDHYVYLHFYDFESQNQHRKMDVAFNDGINVSFTLEYKKPTTVVRNIKEGDNVNKIFIKSTSDSHLRAMLNAYEIYRVLPQLPLNSTTDEGDVVAIRNIKKFYNIKRIDWQGDPCRPINYTWQGITCNNDSTTSPKITSLNLSSSNLRGEIAPTFSNFTELKVLDLSNNNLTGEIPDALAALEKLKYIDLTGNAIKGRIPKRWRDRKNAGDLNISPTDLGEQNHAMSKGLTIGLSVGVPVGVSIKFGITWKIISIWKKKKAETSEERKGKRNKQRKESDDQRKDGSREERKGKSRGQRKESDDQRKSGRREQESRSDERKEERTEQGKESDESGDDESQSGKGIGGAPE